MKYGASAASAADFVWLFVSERRIQAAPVVPCRTYFQRLGMLKFSLRPFDFEKLRPRPAALLKTGLRGFKGLPGRRSRPPVSKGRILRGVWKDGRPMQQGSKNPWFDFDELQKEAKDQKKKLAQKRRSEAEARKGDQQKPKKKRRDSDQPSPPPLPAHLQILKEERDRRRVERSNIKQKKKAFTTSTM
eukprot:s344_g34.t1